MWMVLWNLKQVVVTLANWILQGAQVIRLGLMLSQCPKIHLSGKVTHPEVMRIDMKLDPRVVSTRAKIESAV